MSDETTCPFCDGPIRLHLACTRQYAAVLADATRREEDWHKIADDRAAEIVRLGARLAAATRRADEAEQEGISEKPCEVASRPDGSRFCAAHQEPFIPTCSKGLASYGRRMRRQRDALADAARQVSRFITFVTFAAGRPRYVLGAHPKAHEAAARLKEALKAYDAQEESG